MKYKFIIVGGGIVGLATAYKLQKKYPNESILLLEKENELAFHQSGNNSGVIHSGLYYQPNSNKAKLCKVGKKLLQDFAIEHKIPFEICGKIIVATSENEIPYLEKMLKNGLANGCEGIRIITSDEIKFYEPFCEGIKGIHVPTSGIINYKLVVQKLAELIIQINTESKILNGQKVNSIQRKDNCYAVKTNNNTFYADYIISCAGLYADEFSLNKQSKNVKIIPFRGDYYELTEQAKHKVKNLIYPVPDPKFPFLGVHFTRMINGNIECGPNAVFSFKKEGYGKFDFSLQDSIISLTFKGTWKLFFKHWRKGLEEYKRAYSKKKFLQSLQKLIPSLNMDDIQTARSGVRAQALNNNGDLVYDFEIEQNLNYINILNAPSPAATSCLAIGEFLAEKIHL